MDIMHTTFYFFSYLITLEFESEDPLIDRRTIGLIELNQETKS